MSSAGGGELKWTASASLAAEEHGVDRADVEKHVLARLKARTASQENIKLVMVSDVLKLSNSTRRDEEKKQRRDARRAQSRASWRGNPYYRPERA